MPLLVSSSEDYYDLDVWAFMAIYYYCMLFLFWGVTFSVFLVNFSRSEALSPTSEIGFRHDLICFLYFQGRFLFPELQPPSLIIPFDSFFMMGISSFR